MKIRSITCFATIDPRADPLSPIKEAGELAGSVRAAFKAGGFAVQTVRLATQPILQLSGDPIGLASDLWTPSAEAGFEYLSLGPIVADAAGTDLSVLDAIPDLIRTTDSVFVGILAAQAGQGLHLDAVRRTARVVHEIARTTELGFGNLRLAMLANVAPHAPFFPAAYHDGGPPAFALALESADLAVDAFSRGDSLEEARLRFIANIEAIAGQLVGIASPLAERFGHRFVGIDFSLAPFPDEARSIGAAVERMGVGRFGAPGTLFAAAILTDCLRKANYPRCGFNGLMLPVLEDATLANRSRESLFTVSELLLYSAVCGTGLDTLPLPGNVSEEELAGILLDVAALALRLDKPLTARLMPIPGARAGDLTEFDFAYFSNGCVLDTKGVGSRRLFERGDWLAL